MDSGISPSDFWEYSYGEVIDLIDSHRRIKKLQRKEAVNDCFYLADLIGTYVAKLFDDNNSISIPLPWGSYPDLFLEEKAQYELRERYNSLEELKEKRRLYAAQHNRKRAEASTK